jgi:hypothetical protein
MSFLKTVRPAEASGDVLEMYERQEAHWGYVPNYAMTFSHRPEAMARWGRLLAELRRPVDDRRFELVTFAAAFELKHRACSLVHGRELAKFLGDEAVIAISEGREADVLPPVDVAIVRYARTVARDATKATSGQVDALKTLHGLSDADVFDIAAIAAGRSFFTKVLDALGSEADSALKSIDQDFREAMAVGRPISLAPAETIAREDAA